MRAFKKVETWIFDLDNTLYPAHCDLFSQIDDRMGAFISEFLKVDRKQARAVQKKYFVEHGTTLNGLMMVHDLQPHLFLDYVHDIDHSPVPPNPVLNDTLEQLPGRKIIFTNGTVSHAENVLDRLGIQNHFEEIYDIVSTSYRPKPHEEAYHSIIAKDGLDPATSAMFEDIPRNLEVPHKLGMETILVKSQGPHPDEEFGLTGTGEEDHVSHVTDDLTGFLSNLLESLQQTTANNAKS